MSCGTTLYLLNHKIENIEKQFFEKLFSKISELVEVKDENDFNRYGKITTCCPGIFSKLIELFINKLDIRNEIENNLIINTFFNTLQYSIKMKINFKEIIEQVANKGGLTECAMIELEDKLKGKFFDVFATMDKNIIAKRRQLDGG